MKPENLYNFNKTGFRIRCLASMIVFTRTQDRQVYISDPDNREIITLIESISVVSETTNLIVIMSREIMKEKHFPEGLNDRVRLAVSESGYTNNMLSLEWIKHFDLQTRLLNNKWRMLVINGHGSHLTIKFITYCY